MSEMVERAALAFFNCTKEEWLQKPDQFRNAASANIRRMIEAMREPTKAMLDVDVFRGGYGYGDDVAQADLSEIWQTMIDEAIKLSS